MEWLTALLADIIRPIIREELAQLKLFIQTQYQRNEIYERIDRESEELISAALQASTPEEVKAHLRKLKATRAELRSS